jgi:pseudouridine-5'-phosphate glycosidase
MDSSVLTHSGSYPQNLESCKELHSIARQQGTVLATIAVVQGRIKVGLSQTDMQELARAPKKATKISKRDLSSALNQTSYGTLTLPAAMWVSNLVGIKLLTVLSVEGVRNSSDLAFESVEDLTELGIFFLFNHILGYTGICVICSGIKPIFDMAKSLEVLETNGVNVVTFRQDKFPDYFGKEGA